MIRCILPPLARRGYIKEPQIVYSDNMEPSETSVVQATRDFGEPMFSLIDYPDGLDPDDVFDDAVIGMVTSHVCTPPIRKECLKLIEDRIG